MSGLLRSYRPWIFLSGAGVLLVLLGAFAYLKWGLHAGTLSGKKVQPQRVEPREFPLPALAKSPYLNVTAAAKYVGAKKCAECHLAEYQSYLRTNHSRALSEIDLSTEPPAATFYHSASDRHYAVERKQGRLWHREFIKNDGEEIVLSEFPMKYLVGSGAHARTYLVESHGFFVESPVTWYEGQPRWWLSPGYDVANHLAFHRLASARCVLCHAGRVEPDADSPFRMTINVQEIDCERCHGPGSLHAKRHSDPAAGAGLGAPPIGGADLTIVNPARLSRERNEAICGQCHIGNVTVVEVRGRSIGDFRPSQSLTDYRIDFDFKTPPETMTVVGHFRQMRLSRCYQQSDTLTCTTCHEPHHKPAPLNQLSFYRKKCLACHSPPQTTCGLAEKIRLKRSPQNSCIACHMPARPTEVPHTAFTHHRIGFHSSNADRPVEAPEQVQTLAPFGDVSHLSQIDRDRCLGLAYLDIAGADKNRKYADVYQERSRKLLHKVRKQGLRDAHTDAALASLYWREQPQKAIKFAKSALECQTCFPDANVGALFVLSTSYFDLKEMGRAQLYLEKLVQCRREAEDWALLSVCRRNAGDWQGAVKAAERAVLIDPARPDLHSLLASNYRTTGNTQGEVRHRRLAAQLTKWRKKRGK